MKVRCNFRIAFVFVNALVFGISIASSASAQQQGGGIVGGIFGAILQGVVIGQAKKSWDVVDPDVKSCLRSKYGIDSDQLTQRGIRANDSRISGNLGSCQNDVVQARQQQQQEEAARQAQAEAADRAQQAQLQAQQEADASAASERAAKAKAQKAADAAAKIAAVERHRDLTAKYGIPMANAILAGQVLQGMNRDEVMAAKGNPNRKDVVPPSDELWHYGADQIAFTNGKVTYIGH